MSSGANGLATTLWRAIHRAARGFDKQQHLRVLLSAPRDRAYDLISASWMRGDEQAATTAEGIATAAQNSAVNVLCGSARLYPGEHESGGTLRAALSQSMRDVLFHQEHPPAVLLDAGFALLRKLETTTALGSRLMLTEGEEMPPPPPPRSPPPASESHASCYRRCRVSDTQCAGPTSGSVLVSHPLLRRDVVLLLSAYDGWEGFTMGLVLNDPTTARVGASSLLGEMPGSSLLGSGGGRNVSSGGGSGGGGGGGGSSEAKPEQPRQTVAELARGSGGGDSGKQAAPFARQPLLRELGATADDAAADHTSAVSGDGSSGAALTPLAAPAAQEWTTGNRRLTDQFASKRRTRDQDLRVFAEHIIYNGGPEGGANVTMLHPYAQVRGCVPLTDGSGVCYGGDLAHAAQLVREGAARKEAFTFFKGRVDWQPGELKGEVEAGEWRVAAPRGEGAAEAAAEGAAEGGAGCSDAQGARLPSALIRGFAAADAAESRRRERYAAWSTSVGVVAAAEEADGGGPEASAALRSWLRLRPLEPSEAAEISAAAAWPFVPPPWREGED